MGREPSMGVRTDLQATWLRVSCCSNLSGRLWLGSVVVPVLCGRRGVRGVVAWTQHWNDGRARARERVLGTLWSGRTRSARVLEPQPYRWFRATPRI